MAGLTREEHLARIETQGRIVRDSSSLLETFVREAIQSNVVSYVAISKALGVTEAAVRMKSKRRGWERELP